MSSFRCPLTVYGQSFETHQRTMTQSDWQICFSIIHSLCRPIASSTQTPAISWVLRSLSRRPMKEFLLLLSWISLSNTVIATYTNNPVLHSKFTECGEHPWRARKTHTSFIYSAGWTVVCCCGKESRSPAVSFTREVNLRLTKRPLVFNGRSANRG